MTTGSKERSENDLIEESGVDELLKEELDVAELRVLDPEWLEESNVPVLNGHEDGPQVADVRGGQVQGGAEVFDGLGLWNERSLWALMGSL